MTRGPFIGPRVNISLQVFAKQLSNDNIGVVVFNRGPVPLQANLSWAMLGIAPVTAKMAVRDLWQHADLPGEHAGSFLCDQVAPHDVRAFRFAPAAAAVAPATSDGAAESEQQEQYR